MEKSEKAKVGVRLLKYFESLGCRVEVVNDVRTATTAGAVPCCRTISVSKTVGKWDRGFQTKVEMLSYCVRGYNETHEKAMAELADYYCGEYIGKWRRANPFQDPDFVTADSPEELSMKLSVHGF